MRKWALMASVFCLGSATAALAGVNEPFDYRLTLSFDRLTNFTDVVARGNASVAHPLGSSANPAADDFLQDPPFDFHALVTATVNYVSTSASTEVVGKSSTALIRIPHGGTLAFTGIRTDMTDGSSENGNQYNLYSNEGVFRYSLKLTPKWAVGAELHIVDSSLDINSGSGFGVQQQSTDGLGLLPAIGTMYEVNKQLMIGAMAGIGTTHAKTNLTIFDPRVAPVPFTAHVEDNVFSMDLRAGVGYHPVEELGLFLDGQYRHLNSDLGSADVGRAFGGVEWYPQKWMVLRVGGSIDTWGEATGSTGIGIYAFKPLLIELGYAYNNFPEVRDEFGVAHVFSASLVLLF